MKSSIYLDSFLILLGVLLASSHLQYPENQCPKVLGDDPVLMEITDNCTHFIKCDNGGVAVPIPCPDGLIFDSDFGVCVRPLETTRPDCGVSTTVDDNLDVVTAATLITAVTQNDCTCPPPGPPPPPPPPNPLCPHQPIPHRPPHRIEIPGDCYHFIVFDGYGIGHYVPCPRGTVYENIRGCVPLNETTRLDCCPPPPIPTTTPEPTTQAPTTTTTQAPTTTTTQAPTTTTTQAPTTTTTQAPTTTTTQAPTTTTTQAPTTTTTQASTTTQAPSTTPVIPTHPCLHTNSTDIVGFDNYPGCPKGEIVDEDQFNLEIQGDCNHFIHCDNFGKGWCKICAYAVPPLVFDKSKNAYSCIWARESKRTDCVN